MQSRSQTSPDTGRRIASLGPTTPESGRESVAFHMAAQGQTLTPRLPGVTDPTPSPSVRT
ncbi:hypothetical protein CCMA1212_004540 [Trichoderma ghanense]|uniref:Uncharacterized protein n=1 Tax=Trichoderma ghanense TaxID=65468 RepID=A0ABY2H4H3_9HYPO